MTRLGSMARDCQRLSLQISKSRQSIIFANEKIAALIWELIDNDHEWFQSRMLFADPGEFMAEENPELHLILVQVLTQTIRALDFDGMPQESGLSQHHLLECFDCRLAA